MDPTACLKRLLDALSAGDRVEAENAAADLLNWITKGGFPPEGHSLTTTKAICQGVLIWAVTG